MAIAELGIRRTDIMPSSEAQREASEIVIVNLRRRQGFRIGDEANNVSIRMVDGSKVYGKETYDGVQSVSGYIPLEVGVDYEVEIGEGSVVTISGSETNGRMRDFIIQKPEALKLSTDGLIKEKKTS